MGPSKSGDEREGEVEDDIDISSLQAGCTVLPMANTENMSRHSSPAQYAAATAKSALASGLLPLWISVANFISNVTSFKRLL